MWDFIVLNSSTTTTLFIFTAVFIILFKFLRKEKHLPPCPLLCLPVVGHMHVFINRDLLGTLSRLRSELGDIFRLEVGSATIIVINGYYLLHKAFVKHGDTFSSRPVTFFSKISRGHGIINSTGETWKQQRRFTLRVLKEFGFGSSKMNTKIQKEVEQFLGTINNMKGIEFDPKMQLQGSVANVIGGLIFGGSLDVTDKRFRRIMELNDENVRLTGASSILNFFPFLEWVPFDVVKFKKLKKNFDTQIKFFLDLIDDHRRNIIYGKPRDFVDAYIEDMDKNDFRDTNSTFNNEQLVFVAGDMFIAGVETTVSTLRWALVYLTRFPDIQIKLRKELDAVVGPNGLPSLEDRPNLVFMEAFMQELLRHSHASPNALPHAVSQDVNFEGYHIPQNALIIPNIHSVMTDEEIWKDPKCFRPERFIGVDGKIHTPKEFIPFFFGKRICPGENLARMNLFLYIASILKTYEVTSPSGSALRAKGIMGITYFPEDFHVAFKKRQTFPS